MCKQERHLVGAWKHRTPAGKRCSPTRPAQRLDVVTMPGQVIVPSLTDAEHGSRWPSA
jgi:hypothetical protein